MTKLAYCLILICRADKQIIQLLYHILRNVNYSKNVSDDVKTVLLTDDLINLANKFHRVGECVEIKII